MTAKAMTIVRVSRKTPVRGCEAARAVDDARVGATESRLTDANSQRDKFEPNIDHAVHRFEDERGGQRRRLVGANKKEHNIDFEDPGEMKTSFEHKNRKK